jgi:hypothetical protein
VAALPPAHKSGSEANEILAVIPVRFVLQFWKISPVGARLLNTTNFQALVSARDQRIRRMWAWRSSLQTQFNTAGFASTANEAGAQE